MARIIVNGSQVQIASGYATAFALTNISNAATAVMTCGTGHGVGSGDFFAISHCDWSRLAGRVFRAQATSATTITVEGLNTASTALYPAGTITGTAKEISGWSAVAQVNELNVTGGEQQYAEGQYIDNPIVFRYPTVKSALNIALNVDDDQSATFWTYVNTSDSASSNYAMRVLDVNSVPRMVCTGIWNKSSAPAVAINGVLKRQISVAAANAVTEYTS